MEWQFFYATTQIRERITVDVLNSEEIKGCVTVQSARDLWLGMVVSVDLKQHQVEVKGIFHIIYFPKTS